MKFKYTFRKFFIIFSSLFLAVNILVSSSTLFAAEARIYFEGPRGDIAPGSVVTASLFLNSTDPVNAIDFEISYPKDKLEFLNSDNTNSIISIWTMKPKILPNGNLGFSGGMLRPYTGERGLILKIAFKTVGSGESKIATPKRDVLLADGQGTKVPVGVASFTFSVSPDGEKVSSSSLPFESTETDVLIEEGVKDLKRDARSKNIALYSSFIIVLILGVILYNKYKRKP